MDEVREVPRLIETLKRTMPRAGNGNTAMLTPTTPVVEIMDYIAGPCLDHPTGGENWPNVQEAHRRLADKCLENVPAYPAVRYRGRGIVLPGGGQKYLPSVYVNVRLLRHLGCNLPIQLWHFGWLELDLTIRRLLTPYGVEFINARDIAEQFPCRILGGWELKPFAILHSRFQEVLLLDADSMPVSNPDWIFDTPEYRQRGAWFTPDQPGPLPKRTWDIFGIPYRTEQAFESGQMVINKEICWRELNLTCHYNEHSDFYYHIVHGDKDTFHMAWRKLGTEYAIVGHDAEVVVHSFLQRWFDDRPVFFHRTGDKWRLEGNRRYCLIHEELALSWLAELRQEWVGLWRNVRPSEQEVAVIARLTGKSFIYERVGLDRRELQLLADGQIGRGKLPMETRWVVQELDGTVTLAICQDDRLTCLLTEGEEGVWRGHWLEHERCACQLWPCPVPHPRRLLAVMPVYILPEKPHLLDRTLEAVRSVKTERHTIDLLLVANLLPCPVEELLRQIVSIWGWGRAFAAGPFPSVAASWNAGLRLGQDYDYVLFLNNDVRLDKDCLDKMVNFGESCPHVPLWSGQENSGKHQGEADFACFMVRPDIVRRHGLFDERFSPAYREDSDYFARIVLAGEQCQTVTDAQFFHHGSSSLGEDMNPLLLQSTEKYKQKWGTDQVRHDREHVLATHIRK